MKIIWIQEKVLLPQSLRSNRNAPSLGHWSTLENTWSRWAPHLSQVILTCEYFVLTSINWCPACLCQPITIMYDRDDARHRRRRRACALMSNNASHDNHEKTNWWVSFSFLHECGASLGRPSDRRSSPTGDMDGSNSPSLQFVGVQKVSRKANNFRFSIGEETTKKYNSPKNIYAHKTRVILKHQ